MATPNHEHELIRVKGPALPPVALVSEPSPTAAPSELIRVKGPALPQVTLRSEPLQPTATVHFVVPLAAGDDGTRLFATLHSLVTKVNEMEALFNRAGVWVDGTRSDVRNGEVVLVLAPNDAADAAETCKRVADYLFVASRKVAGATVNVFAVDKSEKPVNIRLHTVKRHQQTRPRAPNLRGQRKWITITMLSAFASKATDEINATQELLDRIATKGYIHKNKAARLKSRLVKRARLAATQPPVQSEPAG